DPKYAQAHLSLGRVLIKQEKWDAAAAELTEAVRLQPALPGAAGLLAEVLNKRLGRWAEAIPAYEQAIALSPRERAYYQSLAILLTTCPDAKLRNAKRAAECAQKLIDLGEEAGGWTLRGWAEYRGGDYKACITSLDKAIALRKTPPEGDANQWLVLAMAHWQLGNKGEAIKQYERSVAELGRAKTVSESLKRLRAEAEGLMGLKKD